MRNGISSCSFNVIVAISLLMNKLIISYAVLLCLLFCSVAESYAQQASNEVAIRAGDHDDFSRIVFDLQEKVTATVTRSDINGQSILNVSFSGIGSNNKFIYDQNEIVNLKAIRDFEQQESSGIDTVFKITTPEINRFRDINIGNKFVLDIFYDSQSLTPEDKKEDKKETQSKNIIRASSSTLDASPSIQNPQTKTSSAEITIGNEKFQQKEQENKPKITDNIDISGNEKPLTQDDIHPSESKNIDDDSIALITDDNEALPLPVAMDEPQNSIEKTPIEKPQGITEAHMISVVSTKEIHVSSFSFNGYLWIVLDQDDFRDSPKISGPQSEKFYPFEKVESEKGTVFRSKLPDNDNSPLYFYGEGGGLVWKIIATPNKRDITPSTLDVRKTSPSGIRNKELFLLMAGTSDPIYFTDDISEKKIISVPVEFADEFAGKRYDLVDIDIPKSHIGVTFIPKIDNLAIRTTETGITISHPLGLAVSDPKEFLQNRLKNKENEDGKNIPTPENSKPTNKKSARILKLERWEMGGIESLEENRLSLLFGMLGHKEEKWVESLIALGKLHLANGRGIEAIGYLDLARDIIPDIAKNIEYQAILGASYALAGMYENAFRIFSDKAFDKFEEIDHWRTFIFSGLGDWQQAEENSPDDITVISYYPPYPRMSLGMALAESALRAGKVDKGAGILAMLDNNAHVLSAEDGYANDYLMGETKRQRGDYKAALEYWEPLLIGDSVLYRAKAGLATVEMQRDNDTMSIEEAIDRLESLRYVWRGDELEMRINLRLGRLYVENDEFLKGLSIFRDATSLRPRSELGRQITNEMTETFRNLFLGDDYEKLTPLEAVTLYEQFQELTPSGDAGNKLIERLAETLVKADLLGRASEMLEYQIDHRLDQDSDIIRVSIRLGAIALLDKKPESALEYLEQAENIINRNLSRRTLGDLTSRISGDYSERLKEINLLRARALSQSGRTLEALSIMNNMEPDEEVNRLRADIAWQTGEWDEAADAMQQVLIDIGTDRNQTAITDKQKDIIVNMAVALSLSGNRLSLSRLRGEYGKLMAKTDKARIFDLLTRAHRAPVLADRNTLMEMVSEVDMFKSFLDNYSQNASATGSSEITQ